MGALSIGNADVETEKGIASQIEDKFIFQNGGDSREVEWDETKRVVTRNTCGFDSIFSIYAFVYCDDSTFREHLDTSSLFFHCGFTALINLYYETNSGLLDESQVKSAWKLLNRNRNIILKDVFSSNYFEQLPNLKIDKNITYINCKTGLGEFFSQLSKKKMKFYRV